ncbi:MAG TPA: tRNA preQ1(34) S-adenosylmethionine ribosyltransferase-isomerase QueA [Gammaproteobacteria bacterium]|nr:tRNA preQ1(34) S-adenosylmethionine ribosyltransferase-isomerase QueA [Gammaproteobacteria bacterium]
MRRSDFHYHLPPERVAQHPLPERTAARLLCLDPRSGAVVDRGIRDLTRLLRPADLLVLNDTRVVPARLFGRKDTGGRVEVLMERLLGAERMLAHVRASKTPGAGARLRLGEAFDVIVEGREGDLFRLCTEDGQPLAPLLERHGHMPLPPYIRRPDDARDRERYQTVFGRADGAVAAPTAGLHFDRALLDELARRGVDRAFVTLHVGAGTFQPVRADDLRDHRMHAEQVQVSDEVCERVHAARERGGRVVAVGTTVVRSLEAASAGGRLAPFQGETDLFITPGYRFRSVDALITNFHLPESTLLMLVCAFGGYGPVMGAYRHAVQAGYRFFSYGDAMFVGAGAAESLA